MKIFAFLFLLSVFCSDSYAATLIFKTTKTISSIDFAEVATVDVGKYKQVRIGVKVEKAESASQRLNIFAVEDNQEILIGSQTDKELNFSLVIDSPPTRLRFSARGNATYHIFVWASQ